MNFRRRIRWIATNCLLTALAFSPLQAEPPADAEIARALEEEFFAAAGQPVQIHRTPLMVELEPLLMQQARHLVSLLEPWDQVPNALRLPGSTHSREHSIRPNSHTALGLAILVRLAPDEAFGPGLTRQEAREKSLALLRFLIWTHGTGGKLCDDGKPWNSQWQSALWAALAGEAAWMLWDGLDPREQWLAARMIADEADRFVDQTPPAQVERDTKAEENAWNSKVISLAFNVFPQHPRRELWRETAIRWIQSSFVREADLAANPHLDGRALRERVAGATIHDDWTLENHHRVHPDYMTTTTLLSYQIPFFTWSGTHPPASLHFNVENIYAGQKRLALPDGGWIYPSGQDWHLRRVIDWFYYHVSLASLYHDPEAVTLAHMTLETFRRMAARDPNGAILLDYESNFASSDHMILDLPAKAYLLMAQFGQGPDPVPEPALWERVSGRHLYTEGEFGVLRTPHSVATFSWGRQVMGMVFPLQHNLLATPHPRGLIGHIEAEGGQREAPTVQSVQVAPLPDALGVAGMLLRAGGAAEQQFAFLALPDGRTIYADRVFKSGNAPLSRLDLGTFGVLNDINWPWHDGDRTLISQDGERVFVAKEAKAGEPFVSDSRWFNLDGLGIVRAAASGKAIYNPVPTGATGRLEQLFHLNSVAVNEIPEADPRTGIAHAVLIFYPDRSPADTEAAASNCDADWLDNNRLRLTLEDDTLIAIDFANATVTFE